mmetsp:Transcript_15887/g.26907  ORF Transcript_15887/g.26907 Transcript_15887/m.26907 type:complete len:250 (-) Transcript_15887:498-1247(-)
MASVYTWNASSEYCVLQPSGNVVIVVAVPGALLSRVRRRFPVDINCLSCIDTLWIPSCEKEVVDKRDVPTSYQESNNDKSHHQLKLVGCCPESSRRVLPSHCLGSKYSHQEENPEEGPAVPANVTTKQGPKYSPNLTETRLSNAARKFKERPNWPEKVVSASGSVALLWSWITDFHANLSASRSFHVGWHSHGRRCPGCRRGTNDSCMRSIFYWQLLAIVVGELLHGAGEIVQTMLNTHNHGHLHLQLL